jgi:hypothetical protein
MTDPPSPQPDTEPRLPWIRARELGMEWGWDCSSPLTRTQATAVAESGYKGHPLTFVWRYVHFAPPPTHDLTRLETAAILDAGLTLLVVQHCRNPGWTASEHLGDSDGAWAVRNAVAAGYPPGMGLCVAMDLEGLANSGEPVIAHCEAWATRVRVDGYRPVLYVGYDCGLTPVQLYELPSFDRYWSDLADRHVPTRGTCCLQHAQTAIAKVQVDPDSAHPDLLGGTLTGLTRAPVPEAA